MHSEPTKCSPASGLGQACERPNSVICENVPWWICALAAKQIGMPSVFDARRFLE
jgi:hypothetical protein